MKQIKFALFISAIVLFASSCDKDSFTVNPADLVGFWESDSGDYFEFCEDGSFSSYQVNELGIWVPEVAKCTYSTSGNEILCEWVYSSNEKDSETYIVKSCDAGSMEWIVEGYGKTCDILTRIPDGQAPLMGVYHPKYRLATETESSVLSADSPVTKAVYNWEGDLLASIRFTVDDVLDHVYSFDYDQLDRMSHYFMTEYSKDGAVTYCEKGTMEYEGRLLSAIRMLCSVDPNGNATDSTINCDWKLTVKNGLIVSYEYDLGGVETVPCTIEWSNGTPVSESFVYYGYDYRYDYQYGHTTNPYFGNFSFMDFMVSYSPVMIDKVVAMVDGTLSWEREYDHELDSDGRLTTQVCIERDYSTSPATIAVKRTCYTYLP